MLRDNRARARAARLAFVLLALVSGGLLVFSIVLPPQDNLGAPDVSLTQSLLYGLFGLSSILCMVLIVASYVALIMWLRRAYYNLHQLPGIHPEYSDGWAAGAWFVPFLNFWRPFTITREVWNDTQLAARGHVAEPSTVLGWWWAAWVLKLVIGRITWRMGSSFSSDSFTSEDLLAVGLDAASQLLVASLTWYVIGRMARFEEQLRLRQQVEQLGQPAPEAPAFLAVEQPNYGQAEGY